VQFTLKYTIAENFQPTKKSAQLSKTLDNLPRLFHMICLCESIINIDLEFLGFSNIYSALNNLPFTLAKGKKITIIPGMTDSLIKIKGVLIL
jgi:hypothetical protein